MLFIFINFLFQIDTTSIGDDSARIHTGAGCYKNFEHSLDGSIGNAQRKNSQAQSLHSGALISNPNNLLDMQGRVNDSALSNVNLNHLNNSNIPPNYQQEYVSSVRIYSFISFIINFTFIFYLVKHTFKFPYCICMIFL